MRRVYTCICVVFMLKSSPTRGSSFFSGKVTALGVLCCFALFVCLTLLASFFLPSHLSLKHVHRPRGLSRGFLDNGSIVSQIDRKKEASTCTCTCIIIGKYTCACIITRVL